jgi:hypothetical protein
MHSAVPMYTCTHTHARAHPPGPSARLYVVSLAIPKKHSNQQSAFAAYKETTCKRKSTTRLNRIAKSQRTCIVSRSRWHISPLGPGPDSNIQTLTTPTSQYLQTYIPRPQQPPFSVARTQSRTAHIPRYTSDVFRVTSARLCHVHLCLAAGGACVRFLLVGVAPRRWDRVWGGGMGRRVEVLGEDGTRDYVDVG